MNIEKLIKDHKKALLGAGRPPDPVDPQNPIAKDSIVFKKWCLSAPKKINLLEKDLSDSDFSNADLRMAGLKKCDLSNSDFRKTDLRGADLRCCNLENVNFAGAKIDATTRLSCAIIGKGLANKESLELLLLAIGGDPEEEQTKALILAAKSKLK